MELIKPALLIIDDESRNVFALSLVLRSKGFGIRSAADARTGMAMLMQDPQLNIVLLDMMMPGMDGYEMLAEIRATPAISSVIVIAVTAQAMTGDREKCLAAGADDYIAKPVDVDRLIEKLNRFA